MTYDEAATYLRDLVGSRDWVGFPIIIRATPFTLGEGKMRISDTKEFIQTLTLSRTQQEQLTDGDAAWEKQDQAWLLAYWWCLEMQKDLERKLRKLHSVYVTPDSSPARRQYTDDEPTESVSEHFNPLPAPHNPLKPQQLDTPNLDPHHPLLTHPWTPTKYTRYIFYMYTSEFTK